MTTPIATLFSIAHLSPGLIIFALTWAAAAGLAMHIDPQAGMPSALAAGFGLAIPLVFPAVVIAAFAFRTIRACYRFLHQ